MLCYTARRLISREMDGMLPAEKTPAFEEHLGGCPGCREYRAELGLGRRLLRATATEPSDSFEWSLQLRLNRALQEAAAARTVPWEGAPRGAVRWWRGFAASSLAGVAVTALVAVLIWPEVQPSTQPTSRPSTTSVARPAAATVSPSALQVSDLSDRLPLTGIRSRDSSLGSGFLGRPVSQGLLSDRTRTGDRLQPVSLSTGMLAGFEDVAALRAENARLRSGIVGLRGENMTLKALLAARGMAYLDTTSVSRGR